MDEKQTVKRNGKTAAPGSNDPGQRSGHQILGILAHVDAGKTTLSEGLLYQSGAIRKIGRVDHGDAFLDTDQMEKDRGITIFTKQAEIQLADRTVTLLDTPGHVDFSPEMERALQVLDLAVLVISGPDGVTGQVRVLWKLLAKHQVPVFLFINKMDQPGTDRAAILTGLQQELDSHCLDFAGDFQSEEMQEELALCEEALTEQYLEGEEVTVEQIMDLIRSRKLFPCFFGSALKMEGVEELLDGIQKFTLPKYYPGEFAARVYKISRDRQGNRLTWTKLTGGSLKVKSLMEASDGSWTEKADQLRLYSGTGFTLLQEARAGMIVAITGLSRTKAGEGLGTEKGQEQALLEPVMTYAVLPETPQELPLLLRDLRVLEEEEPLLRVTYEEEKKELSVQVMGRVQMEILKQQMKERFSRQITFGTGSIVYKETIRNTVIGMGHFEPLRHYAEVQLLMEPGEPGSGLHFASDCREDQLDRNWQRLILTHLEEKSHRGVLIGAPITDMKITLLTGRAHTKHTEGGDFRQATYRAVRQGLMSAENVLLEPVVECRMEIPAENLGRVLSDFQRMGGRTEIEESNTDTAVVNGVVAASALGNYTEELISFTRGAGRMFTTLKGYEPCHNAEEVILEKQYDPELDPDNPTGSVFCSHGVGTLVPWNLVGEYIHTDSGFSGQEPETDRQEEIYTAADTYTELIRKKKEQNLSFSDRERARTIANDELTAIFERTYGPIHKDDEDDSRARRGWKRQHRDYSAQSAAAADYHAKHQKDQGPQEEYLLVDGYNIVFAWDELKTLAAQNLDAARDQLIDIISAYQGITGETAIIVFDAYKVSGGREHVLKYHNVHVVYTREAETADQYIEKTVHRIGRSARVRVATSDGLEQMIIFGEGAVRLSAAGLYAEVQEKKKMLQQEHIRDSKGRIYLLDGLSEDEKNILLKRKDPKGDE